MRVTTTTGLIGKPLAEIVLIWYDYAKFNEKIFERQAAFSSYR